MSRHVTDPSLAIVRSGLENIGDRISSYTFSFVKCHHFTGKAQVLKCKESPGEFISKINFNESSEGTFQRPHADYLLVQGFSCLSAQRTLRETPFLYPVALFEIISLMLST